LKITRSTIDAATGLTLDIEIDHLSGYERT
jgi:hypothetical protein